MASNDDVFRKKREELRKMLMNGEYFLRKHITIGRGLDNNIIVDYPDVKLYHCWIEQNGDYQFQITDLGSDSGTFVNGKKVDGSMSMELFDTVQVGSHKVAWLHQFSDASLQIPCGGLCGLPDEESLTTQDEEKHIIIDEDTMKKKRAELSKRLKNGETIAFGEGGKIVDVDSDEVIGNIPPGKFSAMDSDDDEMRKKREVLRKRQLIGDPIPLPKSKLVGGVASDEDALDVVLREQRQATVINEIKENLPKHKLFFHDFNEVTIILGEQTFVLSEYGEYIVRNPEATVAIGVASMGLIDCLQKINDFISVVLVDYKTIYSPVLSTDSILLNNCKIILDGILSGDCFYEEVKLVFGKEEIALMQLKKQPLERPIEINGETYQFIHVLRSIQSCLLEYDKTYKDLYKDLMCEPLMDELKKRKRQELRDRLLY